MVQLGSSLLVLAVVLTGLAIMVQAWRLAFVRRALGGLYVIALALILLPGLLAGAVLPALPSVGAPSWSGLPSLGLPALALPPGTDAVLGWYALLVGGLTVIWGYGRVREGME